MMKRLFTSVLAGLLVVLLATLALATEGDFLDFGGFPQGTYTGIWDSTWGTGTTYGASMNLRLKRGLFPLTGGLVEADQILNLPSNMVLPWVSNSDSCLYGRHQNAPCGDLLYPFNPTDFPWNGNQCPKEFYDPAPTYFLCQGSGAFTNICTMNVSGSWTSPTPLPIIGGLVTYAPLENMTLTMISDGTGLCPPGMASSMNVSVQFDCSDDDYGYCTENATIVSPSTAGGAPVTGILQFNDPTLGE